jgi:hypothetical protein
LHLLVNFNFNFFLPLNLHLHLHPPHCAKRRGLGLLFALVLLLSLLSLPTAHAQSYPTYPVWWSTYGVVSGTNINDYAAANQGQAKNFELAAITELDTDLAQFGVDGGPLDTLANTLLTSDTSGQANDYAAINLGQLKTLVKPIYDQLLYIGYAQGPLVSGTYPWLAAGLTANDYAAANIGQLKFLFNFDLTKSTDGSGIPDWWEHKYFPGQSVNPSTDSAGDGLTILQDYQQGVNPTTKDNPAVQLNVNVFAQ